MKGDSKNRGEAAGEPLIASDRIEEPAIAKVEIGLDGLLQQPLPEHMPAEMFTGPGLIALADLLPIMTAFIDRDQLVRFLNLPLAEYLEQPRKALIDRPVREMMGEDTYRDRKPLIEAALAGEHQFFVAEFPHPSRGNVAIQAEYVPWRGPGGSVSGVVMLVNDISEQMVAERALKESEARFRRIANQAPALMWVTRLDRTRDFVNDAYMEFLGTNDREIARTYDWRTGIHPDDVDRIVAEFDRGRGYAQALHLGGAVPARGRYLPLAQEHQLPPVRTGR